MGTGHHLAVVPDEIVPPDYDPWDDDEDDGPCCTSADILRRLLADVRDAAEQLEDTGPEGREVGHWLRTRAQRAAIDARWGTAVTDLELSRPDFELLHELPACGCGKPGIVYELYRLCLQAAADAHDSGDWSGVDRFVQDDERLFYVVAYVLDHIEATEHGGQVTTAWLTDKGRRLLTVLDRYAETGYDAIPTTVYEEQR